jgi:CheY-like chemotaxis protein
MSDCAIAPAGVSSKAKVLVIDEARNILLLYEKELGEEGYDVVPVANPLDALARFHVEQPDLVILGISLPRPDVMEVIDEILSSRRVPLVFNSIYPPQAQEPPAIAAEAWVEKSSDLSDLKGTLRNLLGSRQERLPA